MEWIVRQEGVDFTIHYLDDYLVVGAPASQECAEALTTVLGVFEHLGLPVAMDKLDGPWSRLTVLVFELDSSTLEIRLPQTKLREIQWLISTWVGHKSCSWKELESLVGQLGKASRVVALSKMFMRRLFQLLAGVQRCISASYASMPHSGQTFYFRGHLEWGGHDAVLQSQSAGSPSLDECIRPLWVWGRMPHFRGVAAATMAQSPPRGALRLQEESILLQELIPIILTCAIWGPRWQGSLVVVHCNNMGAVSMVNAGYSKVPQIMHLLRCLFFIRAFFHLSVWAVHVPGAQNGWADAISRNHLTLFFAQVPRAVDHQEPIPSSLLALLVNEQPDWTSPAWAQLFRRCFQQG